MPPLLELELLPPEPEVPLLAVDVPVVGDVEDPEVEPLPEVVEVPEVEPLPEVVEVVEPEDPELPVVDVEVPEVEPLPEVVEVPEVELLPEVVELEVPDLPEEVDLPEEDEEELLGFLGVVFSSLEGDENGHQDGSAQCNSSVAMAGVAVVDRMVVMQPARSSDRELRDGVMAISTRATL